MLWSDCPVLHLHPFQAGFFPVFGSDSHAVSRCDRTAQVTALSFLFHLFTPPSLRLFNFATVSVSKKGFFLSSCDIFLPFPPSNEQALYLGFSFFSLPSLHLSEFL